MSPDRPSSTRRPGPPRGKKPGPVVRRGTLRLQHEVARRIRLGHPWVYREALDPRRTMREAPGEVVELVDWDGEFVGRGIWDGESAIAIRVMTRDEREEIAPALVRARALAAIALRRRHIDLDREQAVRLIHG